MIFVYIFGLRNSNMLPLGWPATCCRTNKPTKTTGQMYDVVFPATERGCAHTYLYLQPHSIYTRTQYIHKQSAGWLAAQLFQKVAVSSSERFAALGSSAHFFHSFHFETSKRTHASQATAYRSTEEQRIQKKNSRAAGIQFLPNKIYFFPVCARV